MTDDDRRIETLEAEIKDVGTHMSETDRRVRALETAIGRLTGGADIVHEARPGAVEVTDQTPEMSGEVRENMRTKIADLTRELAGARKVAEAQRRIAEERTGERDEAVREAGRLGVELKEAQEEIEDLQAQLVVALE